jgi:hypothetical protein
MTAPKEGGKMPEDKVYIGTKVVRAYECPAWKESGGHPVGAPGYRVIYDDGYESWSPKDVFERAYREITPTEMAMIS